jgi:hypothetical protein
MELSFTKKPNDWDIEDDADIESPNMAVLGGMTTDEEEEDEGEKPVKVELNEAELEAVEADELKALERMAEEARQDKPDLDDLGVEEEM